MRVTFQLNLLGFGFMVAAVLMPVTTTGAQVRSSTTSFTCSAAQAYVRSRGAVVMSHKNANLYQRFVSSRAHCFDQGIGTRTFAVPTRSGVCLLRICDPIKSQLIGVAEPSEPETSEPEGEGEGEGREDG